MKKQLTTILLVFVLLLTMAGCTAADAVQKIDVAEDRIEAKLEAAEDQVEAKLDAAEEKVENSLRDAVSPAPTVMPTLPAAPAEKSGQLTVEQAQQIALDYLGFAADQVNRLHSQFEVDDGIPQYDVEFLQGDWEYEFEIHAENGKIISYDKDHKYD